MPETSTIGTIAQVAVADDGSLDQLAVPNKGKTTWLNVGFSPDETWLQDFVLIACEPGVDVNWTKVDLLLKPPLSTVKVQLHPADPDDPSGFEAGPETRDPCDVAVLASYVLHVDGSLSATGCAQSGSL